MSFLKTFYLTAAFNFLFSSLAYADFKNDLPDVSLPLNQSEQKNSPAKNPEIKKNPKNSHEQNSKQPVAPLPSQSSAPKSAQPEQEFGAHNSNAPVYFSGQYAQGSRKTGILNLVGNAVIVQDDTTLKSNKAQIFALPGSVPVSGGSKLKRAVAIGNVRIFKKVTATAPEIKATGDEAELLIPERILTLKGKAKIWRGDEYITANVIRIDLIKGDYSAIEPEGTVDPRSAQSTNVPK